MIGKFVAALGLVIGSSIPGSVAASCVPVETRSTESVQFLRYPIGAARTGDLLSACTGESDSSQTRYTRASILVLAGNQREAEALLRAVTEHNDGARRLLADIWTDRGIASQLDEAIAIYQPLADGGDLDAREGLGVALLERSRDPQLRQRAEKLLVDCANRGQINARARLGAALFRTAINADERAAGRSVLQTEAASGNVPAEIELAKSFAYYGPEVDQERAVALLDPAAQKGAAEAETMLGELWKNSWYSNNFREINKDLSKAHTLFQRAADQDYLPGMVDLGTMDTFTSSARTVFDSGVQYLERAFARGDILAAERLGVLHEFGIQNLDKKKAEPYYQYAMSNGSQRALLAIARLQPGSRTAWNTEEDAISRLAGGFAYGGGPSGEPVSKIYERNLLNYDLYVSCATNARVTIVDGRSEQRASIMCEKDDRIALDEGDYIRIDEIYRRGSVVHVADLFSKIDKKLLSFDSNSDSDGAFFVHITKDSPVGVELQRPPPIAKTPIVLRAVNGPEGAIVTYDAKLRRVVDGEMGDGFPWYLGQYHKSAPLEGALDLTVPEIDDVAAIIKGGTLFDVILNGKVLLEDKVPDNTNLYLEFDRTQVQNPLQLAWPTDVESLPVEIDRDWSPHPAAVLSAGGHAIGWLYKDYDPRTDGVIALTVPYMADGLAENAETKGEFEKALRLRTLAYHMSLAKDGKLALRSIQARGGLISPLVRLGRLDKAIEIEEGVIRDLEDLDAHPPQILVQQLLQLGRLYRQHGDLGRAISTTREALALGGELKGASGRRYDDRPRPEGFPSGFVVEAIGELADLYDAAGDFDRALVYRHRMVALDLLDDPEQYLNGDMDSYVALADLEARFGRRDLSLAAGSYVFRKAKADAGQRDKAEPIVRPITVPESTERVFGPPDRSSIIGLGFLRLGDAYWLTGGRFTNAEPFYEAALASGLGSTGPGTNLPMRAAARLAMSRWIFGKDEGNLELLKRAAGLDREGPQESKFLIVDRDTLSMFENAYLGTLDWYAKRGSIDETQRVREAAELYAAIERADTFGRAFQLASIRRESKEKSQLAAVQKWIEARATFDQGVRRETAAAEGRARPSEKQLFAERESSEAAATRLAQAESVLNTEFPDHKSFDDRRLSAQDLIDGVRLHIDDDEMVVDLLPARHAIWALVITRDNVKLTHFNVNDTILTQKIRAMRAALDPHILTRATDREQAFHKIDVKSLAEMWPYTLGLFGSEALSKRRWIIIAHDLMRSVPLEAIPLSIEVSDDSAAVAAQPELWPGLSHEISYLPSLSALLDLRTALRVSAAPNTAFVVADPVLPGDIRHDSVAAQSLDRLQDWERRQRLDIGKWLGSGGDFAPIPETATLGYNILAQLGGDSNSMYAGQRAVRSGILTSRDITRSRTVLFATHAVTADAFPDIAEPFLVLTPEEAIAPFGALTMSDIAGLNLDAELVILSACNTAAPDGTPGRSGFSGLAQAFIEAGARSLLVTQWEIQTGPAEEAITETIRTALLGARPAEAIRRGRLAAAAKFGHPSYWAAFVFVGDPGHPWKLK